MKITRCLSSQQFSNFTFAPKSPELSKHSFSKDSIKELHGRLIRTQQHTDPFSISQVLRSYSQSSSTLCKAQFVFDHIQRPTLLLWNYMIRGFSSTDDPTRAIGLFNDMMESGLMGNNLTFIFVLKACGRVSDIVNGKKVHVHALKLGFESYLFVSNALVHMYGSCEELSLAQKVFDGMTERDLVSWNSLICAFSQCKRYKEILDMFNVMQMANVKADAVTMMKVILACNVLSEWDIADSMVDYIEKNHVELNVYLGNTLIDMYGRRGFVELAQGVFDRMKENNLVSWNSLMIGYAKVGDLVSARRIFDEMPKRDVITWTSMISGYSQAGKFSDSLKLFQDMMANKAKPDEITIASVLSACAHLGKLDIGKEVHQFICEYNIRVDVHVWNSLIDMYCKCGDINTALQVFRDMEDKDSVSWTAVLSGLAVNGFANSAIELFEEMISEGVRPTNGTFVGILLACAHAGLVDKGLEYFEDMQKLYEITPQMKHYGCVVDILSRSGKLERAYEFIQKMPIAPDAVLWRILLSACKLHGDVALAELVYSKLFESDGSNSGNFVLLSDTYAGVERWDAATKFRDLMKENYLQKPIAWSSVDVTSQIQGS